jgi:hypothetical protein
MQFAKISLEKTNFQKSDLNRLVEEVIEEMEAVIEAKKSCDHSKKPS